MKSVKVCVVETLSFTHSLITCNSPQFKRTTPGTISFISHANKAPSVHRVLDPKHPALRYTAAQFAKAFPWRTYPGFALRAVPKGLLEKPANTFPNPPFAFAPLNTAGAQENDGDSDWVSMSLMDVGGKIEGQRVVRVKVLNKLKTAISLVATRGADVEEREGEGRAQRMVFRPERLGAEWVMSGTSASAFALSGNLERLPTPYVRAQTGRTSAA